ncbi:sugar transferase [Rhodococcus antarcticus]|uniref:Sugar transferase n=1 Tax=Rhodococcus antarcticus TaxID=2987751 RepID=A0ABY6NZY8_9NOCA|nr:sugar transferase [Rhodococcus antarcticus]UZJ24945.1 sugar transferase [Rhodococcus antarcticus]
MHDSKRWQAPYRLRLLVTDTLVVVVAVVAAQLARFGPLDVALSVATDSAVSYTVLSVALVLLWSAFLVAFATRDTRILGAGAEEYRRIGDASLRLFGVIAIVAFVGGFEVARGYLAVAFPLGLVGLVADRWLWRHWLVRRRAQGSYSSTVVVLGSRRAARAMSTQFERESDAGYRVVGVCIPGFDPLRGDRRGRSDELDVDGHVVPVLGDETSVLEALLATGADTVAVTATEALGADGMRALAWELASLDVDLVVAPGVVDVAGPRLRIRPVAGLPLLHVEEPQYEGAGRFAKVAFDAVVAGLALVVASPVLLLSALAIKTTSRGPLLYRAQRVGLRGETFSMLKLRTMEDGASSRVIELAGLDEGSGPLFKIRDDPRVTRVGRILRRTSIDELPQLVNVLRGHMSVVGPRPPLPREVVAYTGDVHRRLLVKPGITGLWQVSGRSDLSWEESVRLDLFYVENWSLVQDLVIVWRTLRAVISPKGAY